MILKITSLTHRKYEPVLKFAGKSGRMYPFRWCPKEGRYAYTTSKQAEVDDLFEGRLLWNDTHFGVKMLPDPVVEPDAPKGPEDYAMPKLPDAPVPEAVEIPVEKPKAKAGPTRKTREQRRAEREAALAAQKQ